ncbi:MAG: hypothetical protein QUV10_09510, partial [Paracoccaceae bacterium]|nr:hypothetical protein [Paracoccaceae bacterium]
MPKGSDQDYRYEPEAMPRGSGVAPHPSGCLHPAIQSVRENVLSLILSLLMSEHYRRGSPKVFNINVGHFSCRRNQR